MWPHGLGSLAFETISNKIRKELNPTLQSLLLRSVKRAADSREKSEELITVAHELANDFYEVDPATIVLSEPLDLGIVDLQGKNQGVLLPELGLVAITSTLHKTRSIIQRTCV